MTETPKWQEWNLAGLEVTWLHFDYRFTVDMWSRERSLSIIFEMPFVLRSPSGEEKIFDPERNETLGPLLLLLHRPVAAFAISSDDRCVLRFVDGTELLGDNREVSDAWEVFGEGDLKTVPRRW